MTQAVATTLMEASQRCRLTQKQANDVRWFWTDAEGELGLRACNLEPSISGAGDFDDSKAASAQERYSRVNTIFDQMGPTHTWALRRFYEPAVWRGLEAFGGYAGLSLRSQKAKSSFREQTGHDRAGHIVFETWLKGLSHRVHAPKTAPPKEDRELVRVIVADCEDVLTVACRQFDRHEVLLQIRTRKERLARLRMVSTWKRDAPDDD